MNTFCRYFNYSFKDAEEINKSKAPQEPSFLSCHLSTFGHNITTQPGFQNGLWKQNSSVIRASGRYGGGTAQFWRAYLCKTACKEQGSCTQVRQNNLIWFLFFSQIFHCDRLLRPMVKHFWFWAEDIVKAFEDYLEHIFWFKKVRNYWSSTEKTSWSS